MTPLVYYNRSRPISGCDWHNCTRWFNISNDDLRIGTLLGLRNKVDQDDLDGYMIMHQGRPIQLMSMERVTATALLQLIPPQDYQFVASRANEPARSRYRLKRRRVRPNRSLDRSPL